ncbi:MAG: hypothetical protein U9N33_01775 [Campylobacterota bacterium]|nr:hypothetical protein [Campylobacterota bacterium]
MLEKSLPIQDALSSVYENSSFISTTQIDAIQDDLSSLRKKYSHYLNDYKNAILKDMFIFFDYRYAE